MQQIERFAELQDALIAAISGDRKQVWTALPGIVQDYSASGPYAGTCTIKSALTLTFTDPETGVSAPVTILPYRLFPSSTWGEGGMVTTYPIQPGDEALVIFSSRCIDAWWKYGGVQPQAEFRMHDLSDGFALIGPRSLARSIPNVSTTTAQFRSLDGSNLFRGSSQWSGERGGSWWREYQGSGEHSGGSIHHRERRRYGTGYSYPRGNVQ